MKNFVFIFLLFVYADQTLRADTLRLGIALTKENKLYSAIKKVYQEAFSTLDVDVELSPCSPLECTQVIKSGLLDGEAVRNKEYGKSHPDLIRVDASVFHVEPFSITRKTDKPVTSLNEIATCDCKVGYQEGYQTTQKVLSTVVKQQNLISYIHWKVGLDRLLAEEVDVYITLRAIVEQQIDQSRYDSLRFSAVDYPLTDVYPYLSTRYKRYSEPLRKRLEQMKEQGRLKEIYQSFNISY